jgi:F0F1-type ATP synthase membrane subunit b/b'
MGMLILQFLVLTFIVAGVIIFFLHRMLISSTQGAVNRLNMETEGARTKQSELTQKIKEANEELAKRKEEAGQLVKKMIEDADEQAKQERSKIIAKARTEAEDIISKAQRTKDAVRQEIEKELSVKLVDQCVDILDRVLSQEAKDLLAEQMIADFLNSLKEVDASQIPPEIKTIDIVLAREINNENKNKIESMIKEMLNRDLTFNYQYDIKIVGGVVLKFGSLVLNGCVANAIEEVAIEMKKELEKG